MLNNFPEPQKKLKKIDQLAERLFLLEIIVSELANIFMQTATPDQIDQLNLLHEYVDIQHERLGI